MNYLTYDYQLRGYSTYPAIQHSNLRLLRLLWGKKMGGGLLSRLSYVVVAWG
jgi:hypothetical protein